MDKKTIKYICPKCRQMFDSSELISIKESHGGVNINIKKSPCCKGEFRNLYLPKWTDRLIMDKPYEYWKEQIMAREKDYNPIPVYNRKLARSVIKSKIEKRDGYHDTSKKLSDYFEKYRMMVIK